MINCGFRLIKFSRETADDGAIWTPHCPVNLRKFLEIVFYWYFRLKHKARFFEKNWNKRRSSSGKFAIDAGPEMVQKRKGWKLQEKHRYLRVFNILSTFFRTKSKNLEFYSGFERKNVDCLTGVPKKRLSLVRKLLLRTFKFFKFFPEFEHLNEAPNWCSQSRLIFTSPEAHFGKRNNRKRVINLYIFFRTLSKKLSAELSKLHSTCARNFLGNCFLKNL